jgi:CMP-N-acetylneuraminic acid synthetase
MTLPSIERIATICARGGSKGIPGKNLVELEGESLVARAVRQARESGIFTVVAVTSEDPDILRAARQAGPDLTIERPYELASDVAGKLDAIRHAVERAESCRNRYFNTVVDLDVTTPLRQPEDIVAVVKHLEQSPSTIVLTATEARRSPYFNLVKLGKDGAPSLPCGEGAVIRRQDSEPVYDLTGAVYAWERDALNHHNMFTPSTRLHLLPKDRAWDIDEPWDLQVVRCLLQPRVKPDI